MFVGAMNDKMKYSGLSGSEKMTALLAVAESQSKRARLALCLLESQAANDYAILSLVAAIRTAKDITGMSWGNLVYNLNQPCSEEMLRKIAYRAKSPSLKTFKKLKDSLIAFSVRKKFDLPEIQDMKDSN